MVQEHGSQDVKKLLRKLKKMGFDVSKKKNGTYVISPPESIPGPKYRTHATQSALHPIRRDFKKLYNIDITEET